jgi:hypothetical protein
MIAPRRDTSVRRKGVGRDVAAVELHALDHFELSLEALASSTVITPSLPTFFIASAMNLPISESPFAEIVATCPISSFEVTALSAFSDPRRSH